MNFFAALLKNKLFLITTFIPTLVTVFYYGLIASDLYVSESKFVVRGPEPQSANPLGVLLKGSGFSKAQDDSYAVQEFILSRDALKAVSGTLNLKQAYGGEIADIFSRFAPLNLDDSFEALYKFYLKKVSVQLDSSSSIVTLTTKAFLADDAYKINNLLLSAADDIVNKLNNTAQQDMIQFSLKEVEAAKSKVKLATIALANYRNSKGVIDPEKQSAIPLAQIGKLQEQMVSVKSQIMQLERVAKENPQLPGLRQQMTLLEGEISQERNRVAGSGEGSLAGKAAEYQRLLFDVEFSNKMLASSMNSLEQARNEAQRKQLYIEKIVQPTIPDQALEPYRIKNIAATFVFGLMAWGILTMLLAGIVEHQD